MIHPRVADGLLTHAARLAVTSTLLVPAAPVALPRAAPYSSLCTPASPPNVLYVTASSQSTTTSFTLPLLPVLKT